MGPGRLWIAVLPPEDHFAVEPFQDEVPERADGSEHDDNRVDPIDAQFLVVVQQKTEADRGANASHCTFLRSVISVFRLGVLPGFRKRREDAQLARRAITSLSVFLYQSMIYSPVHIFTSGLAAMWL